MEKEGAFQKSSWPQKVGFHGDLNSGDCASEHDCIYEYIKQSQ